MWFLSPDKGEAIIDVYIYKSPIFIDSKIFRQTNISEVFSYFDENPRSKAFTAAASSCCLFAGLCVHSFDL